MKLFYMPGACSLAPHVVLEWIGQPYEAVRVDHSRIHEPEYLEINPLGKVPALALDDGMVLVEAAAILNYLAEKCPTADLAHGSTPEERYRYFRWLSHFSANVHPAFGPLFAPQRYIDEEELHDRVREAARARVQEALTFLDGRMEGQSHMLGGKRTVLDPYLYVFCRWGRSLLPRGLGGLPHLNRFLTAMGEDGGVQAVIREQGIEP